MIKKLLITLSILFMSACTSFNGNNVCNPNFEYNPNFKIPELLKLKTNIRFKSFQMESGLGKGILVGDCVVATLAGEKVPGLEYKFFGGASGEGVLIRICVVKKMIVAYKIGTWLVDPITGVGYEAQYLVNDFPLAEAVSKEDYLPEQELPILPGIQGSRKKT